MKKFFYWGRNGPHFQESMGDRAVASTNLIFITGLQVTISLAVADIFWSISTRSRWGTWVHTWSMYQTMYLG